MNVLCRGCFVPRNDVMVKILYRLYRCSDSVDDTLTQKELSLSYIKKYNYNFFSTFSLPIQK